MNNWAQKNYNKCPKILNTLFCTILALNVLILLLLLKILSGMANSVDPDQEQSDLGLHCLRMSFCHRNVRTFTINKHSRFILILLKYCHLLHVHANFDLKHVYFNH